MTAAVVLADLHGDELSVGDVIRFRPSGYRVRLTLHVTHVHQFDDSLGGGVLVSAYRARLEGSTIVSRGDFPKAYSVRGTVELLWRAGLDDEK